MNFVSEMYKGGGYFGGYPNASEFQELLSHGIHTFVDLTTLKERSQLPFVYTNFLPRDVRYINHPIHDNQIPRNKRHFFNLVVHLCQLLKNQQKIYVHCKGGHGRSGILVASLLCQLHNLSPEKAIKLSTLFHSHRPNLKHKWKYITCPQMRRQQEFVHELFRPICISYHDYHRYLDQDPKHLFGHLALRRISKGDHPIVDDIMHYMKEYMDRSKKLSV